MFVRLLFLITFIFIQNIFASDVTIGSDKSVEYPQGNIEFSGANNRIATYAFINRGFSFLDQSTTCSFASIFPVYGNIALRGGSLYLSKELLLTNNVSIITPGRIVGNLNSIFLSSGIKSLPFCFLLSRVTEVDAGIVLNSTCWSGSDNGYIVVGGEGKIHGNSAIRIYYFNGSGLEYKTQFYNSWNSFVKSLRWRPYGNYFACDFKIVRGILEYNYVLIFKYDAQTNSLTYPGLYRAGTDTDEIDAVAWHSSGNVLAIARQNPDARVSIREVNSNGSFSGNFVNNTVNANVPINKNVGSDALSWSCWGDYLAVGFENSGDNLKELVVYKFNENVSFTLSELLYQAGDDIGYDVLHLDWSPTSSYIAVAVNAKKDELRIYRYDSIANSLIEKINCRKDLNDTINVVRWSPDGSYLSLGTQKNNEKEFKIYKFNYSNESLDLIEEDKLNWNLQDISWAEYDDYIANVGDKQCMRIFSYVPNEEGFTFEDVDVVLDGDFILEMPIKFKGKCSILGKRNRLILESGGSISVIDDNSQLKLKNLDLVGLSSNNLSCDNNSSSLIISECKLRLDADYTFNTGSILFDSDVSIYGSHKFIYSSDISSTIVSNSTLILEWGVTLSCDSASGRRNLICFEDATSIVFLNNSNLYFGNNGALLTKGTLIIDKYSNIYISNMTNSDGLNFGDGVADNDFNIKILSGSSLNISSGKVVYNNLDSDSFYAEDSSSIIRLKDGVKLELSQSLNLSLGRILVADYSEDTITNTQNLSGLIFVD